MNGFPFSSQASSSSPVITNFLRLNDEILTIVRAAIPAHALGKQDRNSGETVLVHTRLPCSYMSLEIFLMTCFLISPRIHCFLHFFLTPVTFDYFQCVCWKENSPNNESIIYLFRLILQKIWYILLKVISILRY